MKHPGVNVIIGSSDIEKKNPLKQGLKLQDKSALDDWYVIEKKNPLKQGLKLKEKARMVRS